jgi:hypothetical protein
MNDLADQQRAFRLLDEALELLNAIFASANDADQEAGLAAVVAKVRAASELIHGPGLQPGEVWSLRPQAVDRPAD